MFPIDRLNEMEYNDAIADFFLSQRLMGQLIAGHLDQKCRGCGGGGLKLDNCHYCHHEHRSRCTDCNGTGRVPFGTNRTDVSGNWIVCLCCGYPVDAIENKFCDVCQYWYSQLKQYATPETIFKIDLVLQNVR